MAIQFPGRLPGTGPYDDVPAVARPGEVVQVCSITLLNGYYVPNRPPAWASAECEYCGRYQERPTDGSCRSCGAPLPRPR
jgi:hypothetical protein